MNPKEALARLQMHPEFLVVVEDAIERVRTPLHPMVPGKDLQEQATKMLYDAGRRQGFDDLMNYLRGTDEWQSRSK